MVAILSVRGIKKRFYGLTALNGVDIDIDQGEMVGLIGPNGSGKTTLFNCVMGIVRPDAGHITFDGGDITALRTHEIALRGISRTFQLVNVFPKMTVLDNMLVSVQAHHGDRLFGSFLGLSSVREIEEHATQRANNLLNMVGIDHLRNELARNLSYGQQKLLEIAMAVMVGPKLMLLDEPAAAVNPVMIGKIMDVIRALNKEGQTFFIIEHNMDVVMNLCGRIVALDHGEKIAEGPPAEIREDERVIDAYFGG